MTFFRDLDGPAQKIGGKARSLTRLKAMGLLTPEGFVVDDRLFRFLSGEISTEANGVVEEIAKNPFPDGFLAALESRLARLNTERFAVRSSFAVEDVPGVLAPGIYLSCVGVDRTAVPESIRAVMGSAVSPEAIAYCRRVARDPTSAPIAVLIHPFVEGHAHGHAAWDGRSEAIVWESGERLSLKERDRLLETLRSVVASNGPTEIEWVSTSSGFVFLQMRPYRPTRGKTQFNGFSQLPADEDPIAWRWDAAHNPLPLSPAQAGLVSLADAHCRVGYRQKVLGGYLFFRANETRPPFLDHAEAPAFFDRLQADVDRALATAASLPADVETSLATFLRFYPALIGTLGTYIRRARAALTAFLREHHPPSIAKIGDLLSGVETLASERARCFHALRSASDPQERTRAVAHFLNRFGDEAAVWDVASPTWSEDSSVLHARPYDGTALGPPEFSGRFADGFKKTRASISEILPTHLRGEFFDRVENARFVHVLAESDDALFARLQAPVRHALRVLGDRLCRDGHLETPDDIFFVPLETARRMALGADTDGNLRNEVANSRREYQLALAAPPDLPTLIRDGDSGSDGNIDRSDVKAAGDGTVRGTGTGGRVIGRVFLHTPGMSVIPTDAVLVARSILPTELPLISVAAIVSETGGPLDHVATQARERGIPAIVGAAGASTLLQAGDWVLVDADTGCIVPTRTSGD